MNNDCLYSPDSCAPRQKHHRPMPRASRGCSVGDHARSEPRVRPAARARGQNIWAQLGFRGRVEPPSARPRVAGLGVGADFPRHFRISYLCLHFELGSPPESITTFSREKHLAFADGAGAAKFVFLGRKERFSCSSSG